MHLKLFNFQRAQGMVSKMEVAAETDSKVMEIGRNSGITTVSSLNSLEKQIFQLFEKSKTLPKEWLSTRGMLQFKNEKEAH